MSLRTIYLQKLLYINGRNALRGRALYDRFVQLSEETLLGHLVYSDEDASEVRDPQIKNDIIGNALLNDFQPNVIYIEGGLLANDRGMWKIPENSARTFCDSGGVLIVADVDHNEFYQHKDEYRKAGVFLKAFASYGRDDGIHPIYGADESHYWKGHRQILCNPKKMVISEWLRPIYDGIPEILVGLPIQLASWESLVASCNSDTTSTLHLDNYIDCPSSCPFAAVAQIGVGFVVLIAGHVSGDAWLEGCPNNPIWLTNLASFLVDAAECDQTRRTSHRRSPHLLFLSHRSTDKETVSGIAKAVKRGGINIWFDEEQLIPSQSLTSEINQALGKMTHFVIFWSSNCVGAPWVERELNSAVALLIEKSIPLIIVRLDQTPVPNIVSDIFRIEALGETKDAIGTKIVDAIERLARQLKR